MILSPPISPRAAQVRLQHKQICVGPVTPPSHIRGMAENTRPSLLEVTVNADRPPRWQWQVIAGGEIIANGFENGQIEAQVAGYRAMFKLLAAGWPPSTD